MQEYTALKWSIKADRTCPVGRQREENRFSNRETYSVWQCWQRWKGLAEGDRDCFVDPTEPGNDWRQLETREPPKNEDDKKWELRVESVDANYNRTI